MLAAIERKEMTVMGASAGLVGLAAVLHVADAGPILSFVASPWR